ncbi:MAG: hypothetical protein WCV67_21280 [Victivallaceae bacterium]|jgi:hypothetical protein
MKTQIKLFLIILLFGGTCDAQAACSIKTEQDCLSALKSSDWEIRDNMLSELRECPAELAKLTIQQAVINQVAIGQEVSIKWNKDEEAGKNPPALGEGYGEYLVNLQATLFSISDNPKTMDALLDSLRISGWNIYERMIETYGEKLVPGLLRQFNNKEIWESDNLQILRMVEWLNKTVKLSDDSRKQLKKIIMAGLSFENSFYTQKVAIDVVVSSGYNDDDILAKIETLSSDESLHEPAVKALAILRASRKVAVSSSTISISTGIATIPLPKAVAGQALK